MELIYNGKERGFLRDKSLIAFQLFCDQLGMRTKIDLERHTFFLESGLNEGKIFLINNGESKLTNQLLLEIQQLLSNTGVVVEVIENDVKEANFILDLKVLEDDLKKDSEIYFSHNERKQTSFYSEFFRQELNKYQIVNKFEERKMLLPQTSPYFVANCFVRKTNSQSANFLKNLALAISTSLLRYSYSTNKLSPFSYLLTDPFLKHMLIEEAQDDDSHEDQLNPKPTIIEKKPIIQEAAINKTIQVMKAISFIDYTIIPSDHGNGQYVCFANVEIDNVGTEALFNPIICLRVTPMDLVKVKGQIIPPQMKETMGVQAADGIRGWQFLYDDWFETANERGEYWIRPIQEASIAPGDYISLENLQINIRKPENSGLVTVEAFVYFNEQGLKLPAVNRIAFSF